MTAPPLVELLPSLAAPLRARLLLLAEPRELSVGELCDVVQQPQSTVSRHLRQLVEAGWLGVRAEGTSRYYRLHPGLPGHLAELWALIRQDTVGSAEARADAERLRHVLARRGAGGRGFSASAAERWEALRTELFGPRVELASLLGLLEPVWVVADLGCGSGQLMAAMAPFVRRVIGVDGSESMLAMARVRLNGLTNVELRAGDLAAPPMDPGEANLAVLSLVLPLVEDPDAVVQAAMATLAPGGRLLVTDLLPHERPEFRQALGHRRNGIDPAELEEWCRAAGAATFRCTSLPQDPSATGPGLFVAVADS